MKDRSESTELFPLATVPVPWLDTTQMLEVDRAMMDDYRIELIQMMESAGRNLAHLARHRFLEGDPVGGNITVLAGPGGNGGGALVCARRLATWGAEVSVCLSSGSESMTEAPAHQLDILMRMGVSVCGPDQPDPISDPLLIVDGLIGYSLQGAPRGRTAELIRWANARPTRVLSLDAPSGVDVSTGVVYEPAIRADATMTLALPKEGLRSAEALPMVGELYLADIGVPPELYEGPQLAFKVAPLFAQSEILRIR